MSSFTQAPEAPFTEKWLWAGDVMIADDGSEQRVQLMQTPKRSWSGSFIFSDEVSLRKHLSAMFSQFSGQFLWPMWQHLVKLKAAVTAGADTILCTTRRSDFRSGATAFIIEGTTSEIVVIDAVTSTQVTTIDPLVNSYGPRALIMPLASVYSASNSGVTRKPVNSAGSASFQFTEYGFLDPFIETGDKATLEMFEGLPVLGKRATGDQFDQSIITDAETVDYGGWPTIRSRWKTAQFGFPLTYLCQRVLDPDDLWWWRTFADYCRGSTNPFYVPSWRNDFQIVSYDATHVVIEGHDFQTNYYPNESMRHIVLTDEDGQQHLATANAISNSGANDRLTLTEALPGGFVPVMFSMLMKCRIADGAVTLQHDQMETNITLNIQTVPDPDEDE